MKHKHHRKQLSRSHLSHLLPIVFIVGFAAIGTLLITASRAAGVNGPIGFADSCQLENNKTVIYGWAHDNQSGAGAPPALSVTVGSSSVTVLTHTSYRENQIDQYLTNRGYTPTNTYGFKATFSDMHRGSQPAISGTIRNVGAGTDQPLSIATFFAGNKVPDQCLIPKPIPPVVPPSPPPNPVPTPPPAPTQPAPSPPSRTPTTPTQTPPEEESPEESVETQSETQDITITLLNKETPQDGTILKIAETDDEAITNEEGKATFNDLAPGNYTLKFTHDGRGYEYGFTVRTDDTEDISIDIADLSGTNTNDAEEGAPQTARSSRLPAILGFILLAGAAIAAVFFGRRIMQLRRTGREGIDLDSTYTFTPPPSVPHPHKHDATPEEIQNKVGVSLKDMVIESMREEAARKRGQNKD